MILNTHRTYPVGADDPGGPLRTAERAAGVVGPYRVSAVYLKYIPKGYRNSAFSIQHFD